MASSSHDSDGETSVWYKADELMDVSVKRSSKPLVAIDYPGIVENTEKALHTLGGLSAMSKSLYVDKTKLALYFRPEDPYCRPVYGSKVETNNLLMRVRRRRRPVSAASSDAAVSCSDKGDSVFDDSDAYEYKVEILGVISTTHKFTGMCDFQYLPTTVRTSDGSHESILSKIQANAFVPRKDFLSRDVPAFIPPVIFSRVNIPQDYGFRSDRSTATAEDDQSRDQPQNVIGTSRKSREIDTQLVSFTSKEVPEHPLPHALEVADKFKETGLLEEVKKLFEIRPIWSKAAMRYHLRDHAGADSRLKFILPVVAYFFLSGPWRALWVKYGYDPRKDPSAKKYQIFDFRMRHRGLGPVERNIPEAKRGLEMRFLKPSLPTMPMAKIHEINMGLFQKEGEGGDKDKQPKLSDFEFHPAVLPPNRQVYYQLCDIYDQEIQALVAKNDGKEGTVCDEKNGWCVKNMSELCRQIIVDHVEKLDPRLPNKGYKYDQHQRKRAKVMQANMDEESDDGDDDYT